MAEKKWKLGVDMYPEDNILDSITLYDVILAVKCNCPVIDEKSVRETYKKIFWQRLTDANFIMDKNVKEIVKEAKKMRGETDG